MTRSVSLQKPFIPGRRRAVGLLATAGVLPLLPACAKPSLSPQRFRGMTVVDTKTRLDDPNPHAPPSIAVPASVIQAVKQSGLTLISETVGGSRTMAELIDRVQRVDASIAARPEALMRVMSAADVQAAKSSGRLGVAYDVQGTTEIGDDAGRVSALRDAGVRTVQLTYNKHSLTGDGCMVPSDGGLTPFGRDVVAEINRLNLLLDVSHVGHRTAAEAVAAATASPALTHGGCYDLTPNPRNMPDLVLRALADKGGVFGIYLMPYLRDTGQSTREDVLRHIEHAIQVCGEDHVGIGSDGVIPPLVLDQAYRDYWRTEVYEARARDGVVAPNEGADIFNYVPEYNGPDRYYLIGDDLIRRGHGIARVEKILGGNFARLFTQIWG